MRNRRVIGAGARRPIYSGFGGAIARAWDRTVGIFAPRRVLEGQQARIRSAALVAYEAARITEQNPFVERGSADSEILPDLGKLRQLSRKMVRDDAHAASVLQILEDMVVGKGIRAQSTCKPEETGLSPEQCKAWNDEVDRLWNRHCRHVADATRVGTFYDLQALALRSDLTDGDSFGHLVADGDGEVRLELIDADRVESPNLQDTETIRGGIELGPSGEQVAFFVLPHHPDDQLKGLPRLTQGRRIATTDPNGFRVMLHTFKRQRPGQNRGVPLLTPALLSTRHLHHYMDSELIAARAASNFALFIKRNVNTTDADIFPVQNAESGGEQWHEKLQPGIIEYLNEGEEPVPFTPNRPGSAFDPFVKRLLRATAAACGLSYEVVARDFGSMNLATCRVLMAELRRGFDAMRERLVFQFCEPWRDNVIRNAIAQGKLRAPARFLDDERAFLACRWVPPAYGQVDPTTETKAAVDRINAGLSDPFEEAAAVGRDALHVAAEKGRYLVAVRELEAELGLPEGSLSIGAPGAMPKAPGGDPPAADGEEVPEEEDDDVDDLEEEEADDAEPEDDDEEPTQ